MTLKKNSEIVKLILETCPKARDDDKVLLWIYDMIVTKRVVPFHTYEQLPCREAITRARRKLQEKHDHLRPTDPEVILKRKKHSQNFKNFFGKNGNAMALQNKENLDMCIPNQGQIGIF